MILLALACGRSPYDDYWDGPGPELSTVQPSTVQGLAGGQEIELQGTGLSTTRTVVVGQRNAEILSATDGVVTVQVPQQVGPGPKDVAVVTDAGLARLSEGLTVSGPGMEAAANEAVSVAIYRLDCPIDVGYDHPDWPVENGIFAATDLYWCGLEQGYVDAYGQISLGRNAGFAGELPGVGSLWSLPGPGEVVFREPGSRPIPAVPFVYGPVAPDEQIAVTVERDFQRDLDFMATNQGWIEDSYYWYEAGFSEHLPAEVWFLGPDECFTEAVPIDSVSGDTVTLTSDVPAGATSFWRGFVHSEGGGAYLTDVTTGSGRIVSSSGNTFVGSPSGATLQYDDWSGYLLADAPGYFLGMGDIPFGAEFSVTSSRLNESVELGTVQSVEPLVITSPQSLLDRNRFVVQDEDLTVSWEPGNGDVVVVEWIVYDTDIDDPNWQTEVARLTGHGVDAEGELVIPAEELAKLPSADQRVDTGYGQVGYWGELTITRHALRSVPSQDGDIVIDFVHSVNAPLGLWFPDSG